MTNLYICIHKHTSTHIYRDIDRVRLIHTYIHTYKRTHIYTHTSMPNPAKTMLPDTADNAHNPRGLYIVCILSYSYIDRYRYIDIDTWIDTYIDG